MATRRLTVVGFKTSAEFQKTANVAAALEHLYPSRIKAEIIEFEDESKLRSWLPSAVSKLRNSPPSTNLPSVAAWVDDSWVGNTEAALSFARNEFGSASPARPAVAAPAAEPPVQGTYDYDLVVIGGGSGGLQCSKRAAKLGAKVALLDYVKPSWAGTTWGLGGTCVNVGCIPKKLMHQASLLGEGVHDAEAFGWQPQLSKPALDWAKLVQAVQDHIGSLNFGYRVQLREHGITYMNKLGRFTSPHTIECKDKKGNLETISGKRVLIAVGGRPRPLDIPGAELSISSDDLFSLDHPPGKTLVVGASYVALECAGFLTAFGYDTTVMVRSILLRGFDRDCADKVGEYMLETGTKFVRDASPLSLTRTEAGRIRVTWQAGGEDEFDTVVAAVGRDADLKGLDLTLAGVQVDAKTGKLPCVDERTNVPHIYAIGDVVLGAPELTPVAIEAGKLLADRLFHGSTERMEYEKVCTTVFTPLEYSCVGLSEEAARERVGDAALEVYHSHFTPLEWTVPHRPENKCYCKVLVDLSDSERVLGIHYLGPNAGEVMQGYGVAIKMGMTFKDLVRTIGIHPTTSEELTKLDVTKRSGLSPLKTGC